MEFTEITNFFTFNYWVSDTNLAFRSQLFSLALDSSFSSWLTSFVYLYEMSAISAFFLRNASYTARSLLRAASAAAAAAASALELATAAATADAPPQPHVQLGVDVQYVVDVVVEVEPYG